MSGLEKCLQEAQAQRVRMVVTDGVFSMDGNVAPMDKICDLAEKYDALVMVDESHSAGVVGPTGHGVSELDVYKRQQYHRIIRMQQRRCTQTVITRIGRSTNFTLTTYFRHSCRCSAP